MDNNNSAVIEKLKKLIALSESPSESEAASALAKAHILLAKHGLSMTDLEMKEEKVIEKAILSKKRIRSWESALIASVMAQTYTEALHTGGKVFIVGREVNVIAAENLFTYLHDSIIRISKRYKEIVRHPDSFRMGMVVNINNRLKQLEEESPPTGEEKQLTVSMNTGTGKENREFMDNKYGKIGRKKVNRNVEPDSYGLGQKIGNKISLNMQIKS